MQLKFKVKLSQGLKLLSRRALVPCDDYTRMRLQKIRALKDLTRSEHPQMWLGPAPKARWLCSLGSPYRGEQPFLAALS